MGYFIILSNKMEIGRTKKYCEAIKKAEAQAGLWRVKAEVLYVVKTIDKTMPINKKIA